MLVATQAELVCPVERHGGCLGRREVERVGGSGVEGRLSSDGSEGALVRSPRGYYLGCCVCGVCDVVDMPWWCGVLLGKLLLGVVEREWSSCELVPRGRRVGYKKTEAC